MKVGAASPRAIATLLDELDRLRGELRKLQALWMALEIENVELKRKIARMQRWPEATEKRA